MKVLILGVTGMLEHKLFSYLLSIDGFDVYATARNSCRLSSWFPQNLLDKIITEVDAYSFDTIKRAVPY